MIVSRLERGEGPLDLETLERLAIALDVSLAIELGRDRLDTVADAGHLAVQELVLRLTRTAGFQQRIELPTRPTEPWRSIDVAVASDLRRLAIAAECWNTIGDLGAAIRSSNRRQPSSPLLRSADGAKAPDPAPSGSSARPPATGSWSPATRRSSARPSRVRHAAGSQR